MPMSIEKKGKMLQEDKSCCSAHALFLIVSAHDTVIFVVVVVDA
jgi:hypothetical protein